jgi:Uma2 family endonuclease
MHQLAESISPASVAPSKVYPLEHGDHLTVDEFEQRYDATPGLKKAELIDGKVYIPTYFSACGTGSTYALQNGDQLTVEEFIERYDATVGIKKAELIDGKVYVAPPVSHVEHSFPHHDFATLLAIYRAYTPGTTSDDNGSVRFEKKNMPQPDVYLFVLPSYGGQASIGDDGYVAGAPDLIAEIAASSASFDLHEKLDLYTRTGMREYIVWRTLDAAIDYLILRDGKYVPLSATDGILKSEAFPRLWINSTALLAGDLAKALATTQKGIDSPEHADFVSLLQQRATVAKQ